MKRGRRQSRMKMSERVYAVLLSLCLVVGMGAGLTYASADGDRKLQNGSFEEKQTFTKDYIQTSQNDVPSWNTTATDGRIELFRENKNTYFSNGVTLKPSAGTYAAELNADEESTLYQVVKTTPSSVYEWGLDHGARNGADTMALIIGPNQSVKPSKTGKSGRDQFMQMVDWLIKQGKTSVKTSAGLGEQLTVYSKKFAASGTFADNAGNNAFSLTPSTIYTEEWHIWIMASERGKDTSKPNPWNSYGSNAGGSAGSGNGSGSTTVDLSKYYLYTVPAGQTDTLFGFVSVGYVDSITTADKAKTFGNFLDNINFQLYHPLSGSTTTHGSAVVGGSDGTAEGEEGKDGYNVTVDGKLTTYITHGKALKIQAVIRKADADDGCEFVGVYHTELDENGDPVSTFLKLAGNDKWVKSTNASGDIIYTYYLEGITSATDLHFVFIKSPTITYDPNGGQAYVVERTHNTDEAPNVYSFKPATNSGASSETGKLFIAPYVSHAAEGQNDGWKFMGWLLTGDTVDAGSGYTTVNAAGLGSLLLPAEHTIACDYHFDGVTLTDGTKDSKVQPFKIYNGNVTLGKQIDTNADEDVGVTWQDADKGKGIQYANVHRGLTLVAQWRWRQAFIPQVGSGKNYTDSTKGGTVTIKGIADTDTNYNAAYNANGGKSYHAETDETITATATANPGYTFEGWYDAKGNLLTTNTTYSYTETKESVNTYYARFSGNCTQTYIRQVKNGDTWDTIEGTADNEVGKLGRYSYIDAPGMPISSTATAGNGYKFVGWYDAVGNKVTDAATLSYTTTVDATYYARFQTAYTVKFVAQTKQADGSFKTNTTGGKVSVAAVTDVDGATARSKATANSGYKFLGWYDNKGSKLTDNATYSTTTTAATNKVTYYARFEIVYTTTVQGPSLSFVAESADTQIPSAFDGRNAGTGKKTNEYGLDSKFGNTIATGFQYKIDTISMDDVKTIQITVTVPDSAYVKVGGKSGFTGNGTEILTDGAGVSYNKGSIQQISGATTLTYYWDATGLQEGQTYGFIIDNLYAPGATATITVNGKDGTQVTSANGVVNTAAGDYRANSHYQ